MNDKLKLPELLSPAGSIDHLKAAVNAGADAVYIGGDKFSARAYAQNFSGDRIREALHYAHFYDRRVYLTVNTLMKEKELEEELYDFLLPYEEAGLDGVIVQDLGTASFIRSAFPAMEVHGSTQMTITDVYGARAAARMGMTRIVPARELSLEELEEIRVRTGLEVEVFVHGALCYCYSGQCLFSSLYGGRSGNRGRCAQPCRMPYRLLRPSQGGRDGQDKDPYENGWGDRGRTDGDLKGRDLKDRGLGHKGASGQAGNYLISPRDLSAIDLLPDLCRLPVDSLKIEGRMKNVEYVAGVTAIYRKYLDRIAGHFQETGILPVHWKVDPADKSDLQDLYSRGDFTDGYFKRHNGREMMSMRSPKNTGRLMGHVKGRRKNRLQICFDTRPEPQDILVIPLGGRDQEEIVLTVPDEMKLAKRGKSLTGELNAPGSSRVRPGMEVYRRRKDTLVRELQDSYQGPGPRLELTARLQLKKGKAASLELVRDKERVSVRGDIVQEASARPLEPEDVVKQIKKTGNTSFFVDQVELDMDPGIFLPVSALKQLRREACDRMQILLESRKDRPLAAREENRPLAAREENRPLAAREENRPLAEREENRPLAAREENRPSAQGDLDGMPPGNSPETPGLVKKDGKGYNSSIKDLWGKDSGLYVTVYSEEMAEYCAREKGIRGVCLPADFFEDDQLERLADTCVAGQKEVCLFLPRILRGNEDRIVRLLRDISWDGVYIHGIGQAQLIHEEIRPDCRKSAGDMDRKLPRWITAASFYQWNHRSSATVKKLYPWIGTAEYPVELTCQAGGSWGLLHEFDERELMVYGRIPVMVSVQCLKKSKGMCDHRRELLYLEDHKGRRLPVTTHCRDCINQIWQDGPRDLIGRDLPVKAERISRLRMDLLGVTPGDFRKVKARYLLWQQSGFRKN